MHHPLIEVLEAAFWALVVHNKDVYEQVHLTLSL